MQATCQAWPNRPLLAQEVTLKTRLLLNCRGWIILNQNLLSQDTIVLTLELLLSQDPTVLTIELTKRESLC